MNTKSLPPALRQFANLIEDVSDESEAGDGIWIYLMPGYWDPDTETHCVHEDTMSECVEAMKSVELEATP